MIEIMVFSGFLLAVLLLSTALASKIVALKAVKAELRNMTKLADDLKDIKEKADSQMEIRFLKEKDEALRTFMDRMGDRREDDITDVVFGYRHVFNRLVKDYGKDVCRKAKVLLVHAPAESNEG